MTSFVTGGRPSPVPSSPTGIRRRRAVALGSRGSCRAGRQRSLRSLYHGPTTVGAGTASAAANYTGVMPEEETPSPRTRRSPLLLLLVLVVVASAATILITRDDWERSGPPIEVASWAPYWQTNDAFESFDANADLFADVSIVAYHATGGRRDPAVREPLGRCAGALRRACPACRRAGARDDLRRHRSRRHGRCPRRSRRHGQRTYATSPTSWSTTASTESISTTSSSRSPTAATRGSRLARAGSRSSTS